MITIGICDDDTTFIDQLHDVLQEIMKPLSDWQLRIYHDGKDVISDIATRQFDCDLLFMDIFMPNRGGIETARYIYEHQIATDIIFMSSSDKHIYEGYQYHSFSYLMKPLDHQLLMRELERYFSDFSASPKCMTITIHKTLYRIPLHSILYIESDARKVIIHTTTKDYEYYQKLDAIEAQIGPYGFIRCHKSYLVPIRKLTAYNGKQLFLEDLAIPISTTYKKQVRQLFLADSTDEIATSIAPPVYTSVTGALVCTKGAFAGSIIRMYPEKDLTIGRDGTQCDIVINLPHISREHCHITFHAATNSYDVVDCSKNGTFYDTDFTPLPKSECKNLPAGTILSFGDNNTIYRLM